MKKTKTLKRQYLKYKNFVEVNLLHFTFIKCYHSTNLNEKLTSKILMFTN